MEKIVEKMRVSFLGAGSWGTSLGIMLSRQGHEIKLWEYNKPRVKRVQITYRMPKVLPGIKIPRELSYSADMKETLEGCQVLILALPSQALRSTLKKLPTDFKPPQLTVSLIKGIDSKTGLLPDKVWAGFFPKNPLTVLSGPSIAIEVLKGHPTAVVAASENKSMAKKAQKLFSFENLRTYLSNDVQGVQLGGALKNVIAIACGIAEGLGAGTNTLAALLSRGMAEISRLGVKMGANAATFAGLAGWGDVVTTVWNANSRNHRVGLAVAKGKDLKAILEELGMVAEGVETSKIARKLSKMYSVEMPITDATYRILFRNACPEKEITKLLSRPLKEEMG